MFSFELPIVGTLQPHPDLDSPFLLSVQEKYNVQVMFRTRPKLHATLVVVKGCEWEVSQVKEATLLLINHMCDSLAVSIQFDIGLITKACLLSVVKINVLCTESGSSTDVYGNLTSASPYSSWKE